MRVFASLSSDTLFSLEPAFWATLHGEGLRSVFFASRVSLPERYLYRYTAHVICPGRALTFFGEPHTTTPQYLYLAATTREGGGREEEGGRRRVAVRPLPVHQYSDALPIALVVS